jgi:hypothetical protein
VLGAYRGGVEVVNAGRWHRLAVELGASEQWRDLVARFLPDAAARIAAVWDGMIRGDAEVIDRKGRSRRCGDCEVRLVDGALELDIPGGETGGLTPRDLLRTLLPERFVTLVQTRRCAVLYETEEGYVTPLDLVRQRTGKE